MGGGWQDCVETSSPDISCTFASSVATEDIVSLTVYAEG